MNDDAEIHRERLTKRVIELWGEERASADAGLIESAAAALARISALQPEATDLLDRVEEGTGD